MSMEGRQQFFRTRGADDDCAAFQEFQADTTVAAGDICFAMPRGTDAVATVVARGIVSDDLRGLYFHQRDVPGAPETAHPNGKRPEVDMADQANRHQSKVDQPEEGRPADDSGVGHWLSSPRVAQNHLPGEEQQHRSRRDCEEDARAPLVEALVLVKNGRRRTDHRSSPMEYCSAEYWP